MDGMPISKYALQTFEGIDQFKWERICDKVMDATGIDLRANGSNKGTGTHKGVTLSWCYSADTKTFVVDLVKREIFDPSETRIDEMIAGWIKEA